MGTVIILVSLVHHDNVTDWVTFANLVLCKRENPKFYAKEIFLCLNVRRCVRSVNIFLTKFTLDDSVEMTSVRNGTFKGCFILVKLKTYMVFFGVCGTIIFFNYKKSLY